MGSLLATAALSLHPVATTPQRVRLPPASSECKKCKAGGELLAPSTPTLYSEVVAALFTPGAPAPVRASVRAIAKGGTVVF